MIQDVIKAQSKLPPNPKPIPTKLPFHKRFTRSFLIAFGVLFIGSVINSLYPSVKTLLHKTSAVQNKAVTFTTVPEPQENVLLEATAVNRKIITTNKANFIDNRKPKSKLEKLTEKDRKELARLLARLK